MNFLRRDPVAEAASTLLSRRSVLSALVAFIGAAYAFFLLTHVPQAAGTNGRWSIGETEALHLIGPPSGQVLTMTVRGEGLASVSAGPGSRMIEPTATAVQLLSSVQPAFSPMPAGKRLDIRIDNDASSLASVSVELDQADATDKMVDIHPDAGIDETGMRLEAVGAPLRVTIDWSSTAQQSGEKGPLLVGQGGQTLPLGRAVISVPEGQTLYIGAPTGKVEFEIGNHGDRLTRGGLDLKGFQIAGEQQGPVTSMACGSDKIGRLRLPGPFGDFRLKACRQSLHVQGLELARDSSFALSGPAFVMKEGAINYWRIWPNLMSNFVIQLALTALGATLIGWITYNLRIRRRRGRKGHQPQVVASKSRVAPGRRSKPRTR